MITALPRTPSFFSSLLPVLFRTRSTRTDRDRLLARSLCRTLDPILQAAGIQGVSFYAYDGTVTLYGVVPSYEVATQVTELLSEIPEVRRITNNLRVVRPETAPALA